MNSATHNVSVDPMSLTFTIHEDDQLVYSIFDIGGMITLRMHDFPKLEMGSTFQVQVTLDEMLSTNRNPCDPNNRFE